MGVAITFRHMDSSDAIKTYANEKVERLQKFLRAPLDAHVTLFSERHDFIAEIHLSSGGRQYHARHDSDDMYKSIDLVTDKIQQQISKSHDAAARNAKGGDSAAELALRMAAEAELAAKES
ncbi:MAG: ribosome-associated translation inhibitor RaiA [Deltaproteobacteria bacterium]|nr:ribosome-associated translation inhibitor RaiA [Deltaproteobacteria bacterium]